jgi:hypothetical protein
MTRRMRIMTSVTIALSAIAVWMPDAEAQVRGARRGAVVHGEEATVAVGRRGAAVRTDEGAAAVGRRGTVAVGEHGAAAVGRRGVVVGDRYEDHDGWKVAAGVAAGVATGIAVGTMLSRPPAAATTIVVGGSSYWYHEGAFYGRVYQGGQVVYQVVPPPMGAIVPVLPGGCRAISTGRVAVESCGGYYYQRVSNGFQVVAIH